MCVLVMPLLDSLAESLCFVTNANVSYLTNTLGDKNLMICNYINALVVYLLEQVDILISKKQALQIF